MDALNVLCAQLTSDLFAIAMFLFCLKLIQTKLDIVQCISQ